MTRDDYFRLLPRDTISGEGRDTDFGLEPYLDAATFLMSKAEFVDWFEKTFLIPITGDDGWGNDVGTNEVLVLGVS